MVHCRAAVSNLFRLVDHHLTFPVNIIFPYFYPFNENFFYFRGFCAAISFFSMIYMSNYKHMTNIDQFYFPHKTFFPLLFYIGEPCLWATNQKSVDHW